MREVLLYEAMGNKSLRCKTCRHYCLIPEGSYGFCGVRKNISGRLFVENYGKVIATACDPIEKKPLYHFMPDSLSFSIASAGCNFRCKFCQNYEISQPRYWRSLQAQEFSPAEVVSAAFEYNCRSIAYTYSEPTVFLEFALDTAYKAKEKGLKNVFVSNGFMSPQAIEKLLPVLDAVNIDLKSFSEDFYRNICAGELKGVLESIEEFKKNNVWVEVTTLIIPGYNDSREELVKIARFISGLDKNIPWHISRFYPAYKMHKAKPTPLETLKSAYNTGKEQGLNYIYIGNINSELGQNTFCPQCGRLLIERQGYSVTKNLLSEGKCSFCGAVISGLWD